MKTRVVVAVQVVFVTSFQLHVAWGLVGIESLLSRIQTTQCELLVSIGRIPGTAMPPEWAASGARLGFPIEIEFTSEPCDSYEMTKERLLGDAKPIRSVVPLNEPAFVSLKGRETINVLPGAYACELQSLEAQQYRLRFFMDFPEGAVRNDVQLPPERIYFLSSCWIKDDHILERAKKLQQEIRISLEKVNEELQLLSTDSSGIVQKAMNFRRSVTLVERRSKLDQQLTELEQAYPLHPESLVEGPNNLLFAKEGIVAVKRFRGAMDTKEQYWWVGTFQLTDFFDGEFEEEDEA